MSSPPATDARRIAEWFLDLRFEDLPEEVVADTRLRLLDVLGIALDAAGRPIGRAVRDGALALGAGGDTTLLGFAERASLPVAGLVNGTLAHATDFDDTHVRSVMHTSAPVVATALACAEATDASGTALATWVAGANELNCRLGALAPGAFHARGFHPTSVLGVVTAALIASRARGLDTDRSVAAVGITGSQGAGILESYEDGTYVKTLHPGWAAHSGIVAAALAEAGFSGPATVLEGRFGLFRSHLGEDAPSDFGPLHDALGKRWEVLDTAFKPYPCAQAIHPYVDAVIGLREEAGLRAKDVARIVLPVAPSQHAIICEPREAKARPRTPTHARASLVFAVASALVHGRLDSDCYEPPALEDADVLALIDRIEYVAGPPPSDPEHFSGEVQVERRDGSPLRASRPFALGSRKNPLGRTGIEEKFRRNAGPRIGGAATEALCARVADLENLGGCRELLALCRLTS